ncbi:bifunctional Decaprenyl diphosphate synthase-like/Decaprenyl diphosphate synthase-like superfamily [Babesia duncani]|uniref:Alkyl transferase n=1 Tax=Babesia duncani TaxID=323732 RepID=A0AAD9UNS8_9APIC|nr:bifunctional Decaprenyl diphosphate synthase-like/Decaprenyl diphosphate synthase-like superfamily [Babesia duncani]
MALKTWELWILRLLRPFIWVNHVAFIMDGNRRFARIHNLRPVDGHKYGLINLIQIIDICKQLGISTITVFGFALLNFNRKHEEIEGLFTLCSDSINENGSLRNMANSLKCRIRFYGDFSFIGEDVLKQVLDLENYTRVFTSMTINICIAYGARNEIARALDKSLDSKTKGERIQRFEEQLVPKPNVLIRTSNVTRLSDFLIYQVSEWTSMYFVKEMWPELTIWRIVSILLHHTFFC